MGGLVSYTDQTDIFDPDRFGWPVHLVGLGGIGSTAVLPFLKLGVRELHLWDPDPTVEPHNVPAQLIYAPADVGMSKAAAAAARLEPYSDGRCRVTVHSERVTSASHLSGVVVSGVDSMASRTAIWEAIKFNPEVPLYMDGRIGGEQCQLLTVNPNDLEEIDYYEGAWLFPGEEAQQLPCAARTVIGPPIVLAGLMVHQLTLYARRKSMYAYIDFHLQTTQMVALKERCPNEE